MRHSSDQHGVRRAFAPVSGRPLLSAVLVAVGAFMASPFSRAAAPDPKAAGAAIFASSGCTHCHGNDGQGTDRAPTLHNLRKKMPEEKIREQIVHGGQGMPAFGDALQPTQVDELVVFLRAKKWIAPPPPPPETH